MINGFSFSLRTQNLIGMYDWFLTIHSLTMLIVDLYSCPEFPSHTVEEHLVYLHSPLSVPVY